MSARRTDIKSKEYSESIINTVRDPLIVLDQKLRVITANKSFYQFFRAKPEETVGQFFYNLGDRQWDIPKLRDLLETILPHHTFFDNYVVEHDFTAIGMRVMLLNARQILRVSGKEHIILLAIEDITERKRSQELIEASEERYRRAFETSRDGLLLVNKTEGYILNSNASAQQMLGYSKSEFLKMKLWDLGLFTNHNGFQMALARLDRDAVIHFEDILVKTQKGGGISAEVILVDKTKVLQCNIRDISKRKAIESGLDKTRKELAVIKKTADEASEFAESIINTVREPLISLDQNLRVVSVSRSFYDFFKVKPEETVGKLIFDLGNKQWDIPKLRELLETILPQKATFDNYEVEHDFAIIGRRIMLLNARQIERRMGKERIILLAIEDITERKRIEAGLLKAHTELFDLATELKRVARVKAEFLANMSHELRTPLNSINGFSEVLHDETFGPLNDKQRHYVNNVLTSGRHLLLLINQILDMAKVESGKMTLSLSSLPMRSLLTEISLLVSDMVGNKNIQMLLEIAEDLPTIEADELKVKEIIYNLLSNAVKFTPEGGKLGIRAKKSDSGIEVEVWDTGIGIAHENMEKIFEGFFRVDTPYSRVTEGTGLGLPLSRKLVELHGGKLSVDSKGLNEGTSVRFTLPIHIRAGCVR